MHNNLWSRKRTTISSLHDLLSCLHRSILGCQRMPDSKSSLFGTQLGLMATGNSCSAFAHTENRCFFLYFSGQPARWAAVVERDPDGEFALCPALAALVQLIPKSVPNWNAIKSVAFGKNGANGAAAVRRVAQVWRIICWLILLVHKCAISTIIYLSVPIILFSFHIRIDVSWWWL